jgi:hypothetical protein
MTGEKGEKLFQTQIPANWKEKSDSFENLNDESLGATLS